LPISAPNEHSVKANLSRSVVWTIAVLNDGKTECWNNEDEAERFTEWISYYLPVTFLAALVVVTALLPLILRTCFRSVSIFSATPGASTTLKTLIEGSPSEVRRLIAEQKISSSLAQLQKLHLPRQRRRRINRKIVICLAVGQTRAFAKPKKLATQEAAQQVIEDYTHDSTSCWGKIKDKTEDLKESVKKVYNALTCKCTIDIKGVKGNHTFEHQCLKPGPQPTTDRLSSKLWKLMKIIVSYVDFVRDSILVGMLIVTLGGYLIFFSSDFTLFHNLIILLLLTTVVVPMLVSAVITSAKYPFAIFEFSVLNDCRTNPASWLETFFIRLVVFTVYIFVPAILINNKENAKQRKTQLEEQGKEEYDTQDGQVPNQILEELEQIDVYLDEVRKAYLIFKRVESALELVMQMSIQFIMLLLSLSRFPVASGLQTIFGKDFSSFGSSKTLRDTLLFLSVSWSLKTGVMSFLKIHSEQKSGMLSAVAKVVLGLRALLFSVTRILCVVAFFGPFLGLLD